MGRGGKRPGAGAPRGNMNALKHGKYSKQFAEVGALFASDPKIRQALLDIAGKQGRRQQRANETAAWLFTRLFQRADDIAGGKLKPETSNLSPGAAGQAGNRLNLRLDADDLDSIKQAGARAAFRRIRSALRRRTTKKDK